MFKKLEKLKWPLTAIVVVTGLVWFGVVALGDTLGVPAETQEAVTAAFSTAWKAALTLLAPIVARDANGNAIPDILEGDVK